ncbi:hypothetical protein PIB30_048820 [Stylosanthes scabra]|uniref:Metallo-beta-lactamase domain-containing protein n=1 Tax=Stylosanthes scabra TaxID=79078 RepID=A0ABU6RH66_9FABA|nr:hypothetical protein [Stylosanthes scabra]
MFRSCAAPPLRSCEARRRCVSAASPIYHQIPRIDSIVLTHEHADGILGLDDVHSLQPISPTNDIDPTPIYLTHHSMTRCLFFCVCESEFHSPLQDKQDNANGGKHC